MSIPVYIVNLLSAGLLLLLILYVTSLTRDWMKIQMAIWPNRMVRRQRWRYWAHRFGYLYSPSCGTSGIPFADLKHQKNGVVYGWVNCAFCGWSSKHRKDDKKGNMNHKNFKEYAKHTKKHKYPSRPIQFKHPSEY